MRRETKFAHTLLTTIAVLIFAGIAFWLATAAFRPLGLDDIKIVSGELLSDASESKLLCERILSHTGFTSYHKTQILLLQDEIQKTIDQLSNSSIKPEFQSTTTSIRHLAEQTNLHLFELGANLNNDPEVRKLLSDFENYSREFMRIDQELEQKQK